MNEGSSHIYTANITPPNIKFTPKKQTVFIKNLFKFPNPKDIRTIVAPAKSFTSRLRKISSSGRSIIRE